jgi:hypothetical protein
MAVRTAEIDSRLHHAVWGADSLPGNVQQLVIVGESQSALPLDKD